MLLQKLKAILKDTLPPMVVRGIGRFIWVRWHGNYPSWESAQAECSGYNSPLIFEKVRDAMLKVKRGEAACERDSMVFDEIQHSFPLLSALNYAARKSGNRLHVLDFGGSMGTSYFQNRAMLNGLEEFHWCVVEQKHFVEEGRRSFADEHLHFHDTIESVFAKYPIDFVLLSSVLQFLENPRKLVEELLAHKPRFVLVDRAPLMKSAPDRLTIQTVPASLYEATYPCWLLNEQTLWDRFHPEYELRLSGDLQERINISEAQYRFGFFERRDSAGKSRD